jgi:PadR family transcriptional regulator PadR
MSRSKIADDAPLGSFEEQVMLAVIRTAQDAYGMIVRREIESQTDREIAIGAVYATLERLEAKDLVTSRRGTVDGVSRRLFTVTSRGVAALAQTKAMRERLWEGVNLRKLGSFSPQRSAFGRSG